KEEMTMDEYKQWFMNEMSKMPVSAWVRSTIAGGTLTITEECFDRMKNDPEWENTVLNMVRKMYSVNGIMGAKAVGYQVIGASPEECYGYAGPIGGSGSNILGNEKSWWEKRHERMEKLLEKQVSEDTEIAEMKKFLDEKFNVNTVVADYSCAKTDTEAQMYDTAMLEKYDMYGGRNVIISKKALLRMKKDNAFRKKVYKSIEEIPWSGKLTGGLVKSHGVFIHEDGTGGYYLEFDWGDEESEKKKKSKAIYADRSELKNLNILKYDETDNIGFQTEVLFSLAGVDNIGKRKNGRRNADGD
ncbi:MAG: hypothetical protein NC086_08940, partial [Alistipes sp.]|nr:hypothetical protein [Alistipes sp.]